MEIEVYFNGYRLLDYVDKIRDVRRDLLTPRTLVTQKVHGRAGEYLFGVEKGARITEVDVMVIENSYELLQKRVDELAYILDTDEAVELVLGDEDGKVRYAILDGETPLEEIGSTGLFTLVFYQPDPHKYGPTRTQLIHDPGGDPEANPIIENNGTAPTYPTFRATVLEPTTFIDIVSQDDYMRLGYPIDVEQIEFEEEELILHSRMNTTTGWTSGTQVDNGTVSGTMASDGSQFVVTDFGEESDAKWHGPALKTSLSEPLQNFRAEMTLENMNDIETVGRVELYLLDEGNEIIAMISLRDAWQTIRRNRTSAFMRNPDTDERHYTIGIRETTKEATGELWNHFKGMLQLERIGNRWRSYIAKIRSDGTHHARETRWFKDMDEKFVSKVAQIQVHMGKFGGYPPTQMSIKDLKVWKINQPDDMQIPYIAYPGDEIVIDHQQNLVLRNGEPFLHVKDFGARFFPLQPGQTEIAVQPSDSVILNARWNEVYK